MRNLMLKIKRPDQGVARLSNRLLVLALVALFLNWPTLNYVQAAASDLDHGFGGGGKVTTDFSNSTDNGNALAVQRDGKIIVAGSSITNISTQHDFALARYNSDGSLDSSFGTGGKVKTDFFGLGDEAFAIAMQNDGKIIAAGISGIGTSNVIGQFNPDFALARYNSDGSLDLSFGNGGKVTTDFFGLQDQIFAIAIQTDGKIIAVGYASFFNKVGLARYNSDGSLDSSFGTGGKVTTDFGDSLGFAHAVAIQSNGKIVVAGTTFYNSEALPDFGLVRYNSDGSLDSAFGTGGKVITDFGGSDDQAFAVAIQADGKIVVAGTADFFSRFGLARYNTNGSLDTSFGIGGKVITPFLDAGFGFAQANALIIQNDGKIIAAGGAYNPSTNSDFALARYNSNGSLDNFFGAGGKVANDFFGLGDQVSAAALQSDGKIIVAGTATTATAGHSDFALARYNGDSLTFDLCLQDDSSSNFLQINTTTGAYQFTNCTGLTIGGTGMLTKRGTQITLQHNAADRRVMASVDTSSKRATASIQLFSQGRTFSILDRNITNNTCACR